jgi:membrane associated rhomboid family serine protease
LIPIRDENPSSRSPFVSWSLIGACIVVYLWQLSLGGERGVWAIHVFGLIPALLTGQASLPPGIEVIPPAATVFSSMFLHGGFMHLAGNMLYLWIFGDNIEDSLGHVRFAVFYVLCGVAAAMAQALPDPASEIPMIGASGAISGVLGAYLLRFPKHRVVVAVPIGFILQMIRLPAVAVLGVWFLLQLVSSLALSSEGGGVAFRAHLGGFVAGMVLLPVFLGGKVRE